MPNAKEVFDLILSCKSGQPTVIFDLDSTLYNVSHRSQRIINNFAREANTITKYPKEAQLLSQIKVQPTDWGMKEAFLRTPITAPDSFYAEIKDYWKKYFFSSQLLHEDIPYPGAVEYVQALARRGAQIYYLTGRDAKNMREGTIESLKQWNFPTFEIDKTLIMKPEKGLVEDEDFKAIKLNDFQIGNQAIWFFENEPIIIDKVIQAAPHVKIVWLDTTHSRKGTAPEGTYIIKEYLQP